MQTVVSASDDGEDSSVYCLGKMGVFEKKKDSTTEGFPIFGPLLSSEHPQTDPQIV